MFDLQVEVVDDQVVEKASNCDFHEKNSDYVPHSRAVVQHHLKEGIKVHTHYGCTVAGGCVWNLFSSGLVDGDHHLKHLRLIRAIP